MSYTNQQTGGYQTTPTGGRPTYSEAWALITAARKIVESTQIENEAERKKQMQAALRKNWKLWTIFQAELALPEESSVPEDIRVNMLTLAKFVDNHTMQQLSNPEPDRVMVLVDINRNIANGLLEGAKASEDARQAEQATMPQQNMYPNQPSQQPQQNQTQPAVDPSLLQGLNEEA